MKRLKGCGIRILLRMELAFRSSESIPFGALFILSTLAGISSKGKQNCLQCSPHPNNAKCQWGMEEKSEVSLSRSERVERTSSVG